MADEKHGSAVRDSDGVKPASVQIFTSRDRRERLNGVSRHDRKGVRSTLTQDRMECLLFRAQAMSPAIKLFVILCS